MDDRDVTRIRMLHVDRGWATARTLIKGLVIAWIAYQVREAVSTLSGQQTGLDVFVSVTISALAEVKFALAITAAGVSIAWALLERRLRHTKVEKLHSRIKDMELRLDPNRSTSSLTPQGRTNPEDIK